MNRRHITFVSSELKLSPEQVQAVAGLLEEGATIPFIARYRKEMTGSLDEVSIGAIRDQLSRIEVLDKRRETVLKSLEEQGKLTGDLKEKVLGAETLSTLEDLYLPYRPKRRTRATIARERGMEPLAALLLAQDPALNPLAQGARFVNEDVSSLEDALSGARDIIAEWVNEDVGARGRLREIMAGRGSLQVKVVSGKEQEAAQYRDYFNWEEPLAGAPSHRVLAVRRGEKEGFLVVRVLPPEGEALAALESLFVKGRSPASEQVRSAVHDGFKRLLLPSLETEAKQWSKERADREAIRVFAENLRHLLMAPPLKARRIMAIDPGFRTGCKVVCLDPQGNLTHHDTVYPHSGERASVEAGKRLRALASEAGTEVVAVGNGTAGRETESFVRGLGLSESIQIVMADESGASVYSASAAGREELPEHDVTVRGAVSIGRRLMDPMAELVKIDPKSIGVGQYQHDVDQGQLKQSLDDVVMSCVNAVGVEVNTASPHLLAYVSGLGPRLAENIVRHRKEKGPFRSREALRKVPRLGPKAFEQAAGFLRIRDGANPLDASAVHPESYSIVEAMARDTGCAPADLMRDPDLRKRIDVSRYATAQVGLPTLNDILAELAKPGRDPRDGFEPFSFAPGIERVEDLVPGMKLPGIVTNVAAFGAFVDIGVHRDGLVHVSELSDHFVRDPGHVVRVHQRVTVTVLEVDRERNRIALSMKTSSSTGTQQPRVEKNAAPPLKSGRSPSTNRKSSFNNPFETAFKKR